MSFIKNDIIIIYIISCFCMIFILFFSHSSIFIFSFPSIFYLCYRFIKFYYLFKLNIFFSSFLTLFIIFALSSFGRNLISEYYIAKSSNFLAKNDIIHSIEYFQKAKRFNPDNPKILFLQYKSANSMGQVKKAYKFLEKAIYNGYDDVEAWYDLARLHNKYGKRNKEIKLYRRILKKDKNHPEANYCIAMYYSQIVQDRDKAIHHIKIARDNLPEGNLWRKRCKEILDQLKKFKK